MGRTPICLFVCWAHSDKLAGDLLHRLARQLAPSRRYEYRVWCDEKELLPGRRWEADIEAAIATRHGALVLLSPALLASRYIVENELPRLVGDEQRPLLPVLLSRVDFEHQVDHGLARLQIFGLQDRPYDRLRGDRRDRFAHQLFLSLEATFDQRGSSAS